MEQAWTNVSSKRASQKEEQQPKKEQKKPRDENYVPKLHPDMPDWKKELYYTKIVLPQFPRLDGKPVDTRTEAYKRVAIGHVNALLAKRRNVKNKRENAKNFMSWK